MNRRQLLRGLTVGGMSSISGCSGIITGEQPPDIPLTRIETTNLTGEETDIQIEITSLSGEVVFTHSETLAEPDSGGAVDSPCIDEEEGLDIKNVFDYNYNLIVNNEREATLSSETITDKYNRHEDPEGIKHINIICLIHDDRLVIAADLAREFEENPCMGR